MSKTKGKIADLARLLQTQSGEFVFQSPEMVEAPFSVITDLSGAPRQLPDPSKTIRLAMGRERIIFNDIRLVANEKSSSGQMIYEINSDPRLRYSRREALMLSDSNGLQLGLSTGQFIEVTFFGTGINLLYVPDTSSPGTRIITPFSNGVAGTTFDVNTNTSLDNRSVRPNVVHPIVSGLAMGLNTVRLQVNSAAGVSINGIEIVTNSTSIQIPPGEINYGGKSMALASLQSIAYDSGFDGAPVLNGRGGRASVYLRPNGTIGKALQQTASSQLNLNSADHSDEELITRQNFREYGVSRTDDLSTIGTVSDRAFTKNNGLDTIVAEDCLAGAAFGGSDILRTDDVADYISIMFEGTGIDVLLVNDGSARTQNIFIDNVNIGTISANGISDTYVQKIVSGLPYGMHNLRITNAAGGLDGWGIMDIYTYGPKKPTVPDGCIEIGEYYLTASYDGSNLTGTTILDNMAIARGVYGLSPVRELKYVGAGWSPNAINTNTPFGFEVDTASSTQPVSMEFFGTGVVVNLGCTTGGVYTVQIFIDGVLNASGVVRSNMSNGGGGLYSTTSTSGDVPARVEFTGLSLGPHTITIQRSAGAGALSLHAMYVITPVHFPNTQVGSLSMGPGVKLFQSAQAKGLDLSKAKAWIAFDGTNQQILGSYGMNAVLRDSAGVYMVMMEKPMRDNNYVAIVSSDAPQTQIEPTQTEWSPTTIMIFTENAVGTLIDTTYVVAAIFGEMLDEED